MKATQVSERVYADTSGEGKGNIGAIELPNYAILIDSTFSTRTANAFRKSLESKIEPPISKLVLTHYHLDHICGIPVFRDCSVIASEPYKKLRRTAKYQPTLTFEKSLILKDEDFVVEIVHAGGHTEDSSYIYLPQEKTLFSGDLIFAKSFFYAGDRTFNPEKWLDVLKHFTTMEIETIVPGHGPLCDLEEVETYIDFFEATSSTMKELVQKGMSKKKAVKSKSFPDFHAEYREGIRELALANWHDFYGRKG